MKIYRIEVLVVDTDQIGEKEIKDVIENARYPNRCISPQVKKIESRDIGEWHDDHPLNNTNTADAEYQRLFATGGALCGHYTAGISGALGWECSLKKGHDGPHEEGSYSR